MTRCLKVLLTLSCLTGCADWPAGVHGFGQETRQDGWPDPVGGSYDFDWHLSGDRAVAPLQVFDDGRRTWLQFQTGQSLPALFGVRDGIEQLLRYQRLDPYVQIEGVWQALVLRGGALTARARYQGENLQGRSALLVTDATVRSAAVAVGAVPVPVAVQSMPLAPIVKPDEAGRADRRVVASASAAVDVMPLSKAIVQPDFRATPADANIRRTLARWAKSAQWTFEPEHWTLDVDIPLSGSADFPPDFRQAVRQLLAATELSDRPAQPCFYSNSVLRVVPLTQACDRTARHAGAAL